MNMKTVNFSLAVFFMLIILESNGIKDVLLCLEKKKIWQKI